MPSIMESYLPDDPFQELSAPVVSLKEALPIRELINKHQTEFEVRPEEDDTSINNNSAEALFDFEDIEKLVNLDLLDVDTSEDGEHGTPFDKYRRKMIDIRPDGKLKKFTLKQGVGSLVPDNCIVYVRYQAYIEYNEVPYDSTVWQGDKGDLPVPLNLGKGEILPGLHEAILTMRKGERSEFLLHPDLAYGKMGCPPRMPQDATVLFVIEVDRFVDCGDIYNDNDDLSMEERNQFCNMHKKARAFLKLGNDFFSKGSFFLALNKYRLVINMCHNARLADENEEKERNHLLLKSYTNASVCYHKLRKFKGVCTMAADAMRVCEKSVMQNKKLLYFWGTAKMMLGDFEGAKKHLKRSQMLDPLNREIVDALKELENRKSHAIQEEKLMMRRAFGFATNEVKIKEIDEEEVKLRDSIGEQLDEFIRDSNRNSMLLKDTFTSEEEKLWLQLAKDRGLYSRVVDGENRLVHIKKPEDME